MKGVLLVHNHEVSHVVRFFNVYYWVGLMTLGTISEQLTTRSSHACNATFAYITGGVPAEIVFGQSNLT